MRLRRTLLIVSWFVLSVAGLPGLARAQDSLPQSCADCHDGKGERGLPGPPHQAIA